MLAKRPPCLGWIAATGSALLVLLVAALVRHIMPGWQWRRSTPQPLIGGLVWKTGALNLTLVHGNTACWQETMAWWSAVSRLPGAAPFPQKQLPCQPCQVLVVSF